MIISIEDQTVAEINQKQQKQQIQSRISIILHLMCNDHWSRYEGITHILCTIKKERERVRDVRFVQNNVNEFIGIIKSMWRCVKCVVPLLLLCDFLNRSMCVVSSFSFLSSVESVCSWFFFFLFFHFFVFFTLFKYYSYFMCFTPQKHFVCGSMWA